jgi:hypothetical protein
MNAGLPFLGICISSTQARYRDRYPGHSFLGDDLPAGGSTGMTVQSL